MDFVDLWVRNDYKWEVSEGLDAVGEARGEG